MNVIEHDAVPVPPAESTTVTTNDTVPPCPVGMLLAGITPADVSGKAGFVQLHVHGAPAPLFDSVSDKAAPLLNAAPICPVVTLGQLGTGSAVTVIWHVADAVPAGTSESVTVTVYVKVPTALGDPENTPTPPTLLIDSPLVLPDSVYVYAGVPNCAVVFKPTTGVPRGSTVFVGQLIVGAAFTIKAQFVCTDCLLASVTFRRYQNVPGVVGVPNSCPVVVLSDTPVGSVAFSENVSGGAPPFTCGATDVKGTPTSAVVVPHAPLNVGLATMRMLQTPDACAPVAPSVTVTLKNSVCPERALVETVPEIAQTVLNKPFHLTVKLLFVHVQLFVEHPIAELYGAPTVANASGQMSCSVLVVTTSGQLHTCDTAPSESVMLTHTK